MKRSVQCLACSAGGSEEEYCSVNPGKVGCTAPKTLLSKSVRDVDLSTTVYIITHGGCPDGQASAWIMQGALKVLKADAVQVIQGAHGDRISPEDLLPDSVLLFVDVCPVAGDSKNIEDARQVFVMDHHPTAPKDIAPLKERYGDKIIDLSITDTKIGECGASLVQKFCEGTFSMPQDILELFWKLDVFSHAIPDNLQAKMGSFKGWITQRGNMSCNLELVDALVADPEECLKKGDVLYEPVRQNSENCVKNGAKIVHQESGLIVYAVDVDELRAEGLINDLPVDLFVYQCEIDKFKQEGIAIAFLRVDRKIAPASGAWNLGLRRAGDHLDMGKVAMHLRDNSIHFVSGGGHPYAAGAHSKNPDLAVSDFIEDVTAACRAVLRAGIADRVLQHFTSYGMQTASASALFSVVSQLNIGVTEEQFQRLITSFTVNSDKEVDCRRFLQWLFHSERVTG